MSSERPLVRPQPAPSAQPAPQPLTRVLVVDDDEAVLASLGLLLRRAGYEVVVAPDAAAALERAAGCDVVVQDMNFSRATTGEEGLALLAELIAREPRRPVVLLTAWASVELAVAGMKAGAADFVTKPWNNERLLQALATALALGRARPEEARAVARAELDQRLDLEGLVGEDPALLRALDLVGRVAATDASVLVVGESGTGKELIAAAIHRNSPRRQGPFVKVNLGGISGTLFESEMFGHVRGAFTDAKVDRRGRFDLADRGTIFLDEIGEVEPPVQVKLLRVLQDRSFEVLGSSRSRQVDVRVVAATNADLPAMVAAGTFRQDLLYRIGLITIRLPPLRERLGDIPGLAATFLASAAEGWKREAPRLAPDALAWLSTRPWPGNLRQLKQTMERTALVAEGPVVSAEMLERLEDLDVGGEHAFGAATPLPAPGSMTLDQLEEHMIRESLVFFGGNLTRVAQALGLSRQALYRRLARYGLESGRD